MAHLHELLAVEGDLRGEKDKIREETLTTFSKKANLFSGFIKTLEMFDDSRREEEAGSEERVELVTTVPDKLKYMSGAFIRFWDAKLQKEVSNQEAKANITIDGQEIFKDLPVTFLLSMEEELKQLRKLYEAIPTLQPGISWIKDPQKGENFYKTEHPQVRHKTEKTVQHKILVAPTKEHPAQIREWSEDKPVGRYTTEQWCGMVSSAEKSAILGKVDKMLRAVKKARQRANNQVVQERTIAKEMFDYFHS